MTHKSVVVCRDVTILAFAFLATAAVSFIAGVPKASAGDFVAIVEDIDSTNIDYRYMDYIAPGTVIELAPGDRLILGYIGSCLRETIVGAKVVVGWTKSTVIGGTFRREHVECDGGQILLTAEQAAKSGVLVFRKPPFLQPRVDTMR